MFEEAFTMPLPDMIQALQDMGVEQTLISHAEADPRLLAGLYIYVHVEALNMETCPVCGQPDNCGECDHTPLTPAEDAMLADPWRQSTQSCRKCNYLAEGKWDGAASVSHTCGQDEQPDTDDGTTCKVCKGSDGKHFLDCSVWSF